MLRRAHRIANPIQRYLSTRPYQPLACTIRQYSSDTEPSRTHNVAILGGGITGLASAYFLTQQLPTARATIFEASDRMGGWLSSKRVPVKDGTILFEAGPRTLRPHQNGVLAARLMQELDIAKDAIFPQNTSPAARNRFVYYPNHLVRMPHPSFGFADNLWSILTEPVFEGAAWGILTEYWKAPRDASVQDESVGEFFSRRLGPQIVDNVASAVLHGIYAGDVYKLSAKSLFNTLWRNEVNDGGLIMGLLRGRADGIEVPKRELEFMKEMRDYKWDPLLKATMKTSTVFTFKDGLQQLADALARRLFEQGNVEFKPSTPIESVILSQDQSTVSVNPKDTGEEQSFTHVISALSPGHLAQVLRSTQASGSTSLVPTFPSVTVMTVNLYYRTPDLHPAGFGYLIPRATPFENNPERALGVVFDTAYSPSPSDLDMNNWQVTDVDQLKKARERGQLVNVNDFGWYNMPDRPNAQDDVSKRGTKITVMLGGHWWNDWPAFPNEQEGLALAKSVVERQMGIKEEPEAYAVNLQKDCIPQYNVGHEQRLKQVHNNLWREYKGKLRVAGNWMSGVGVNDCLRSAWDVAQNLKGGKEGTGLEHVGTNEYIRIKPWLEGAERGQKE